MTILATVLGVIGAGLIALALYNELRFVPAGSREEVAGTFLMIGPTLVFLSLAIFIFGTGKALP